MKMKKMLTKKNILQCLTNIKIDSSIEISEQDLDAKVNIIYDQCKELTDDEFKKATNQIICKGIELYGKLPKAALFLKKQQDPEEQAELEAERIIDTASYPCPVIFDNGFTNAALKAYGGIGKVYFDVHDSFNRDRKSRHWVKKELISIWIHCHFHGKTSNEPSYPAISSKNDHIDLVGDKVKCQELLDSSQKLLEEPRNEEMDKIIGKLEREWTNK